MNNDDDDDGSDVVDDDDDGSDIVDDDDGITSDTLNGSDDEDEDDNDYAASLHIDLMWLFGIQRAATCDTVHRHGRPVPFSKEGKELQRSYRRRD